MRLHDGAGDREADPGSALATRARGVGTGTEVRVNGGAVSSASEVGMPEGTAVHVAYLFYNLPARRKFLKSDAAESAQVSRVVTQLYDDIFLNQPNASTSRPDFPTAAQIISAEWQRTLNTTPNVIVSIDPIGLARLLEVTGPVTMSDGEVLDSVERLAGMKLTVREEPRRAGDPPSLIAKAERVRNLLKWTPRHNQLDTIVRTSLDWEKRLKAEPWQPGS